MRAFGILDDFEALPTICVAACENCLGSLEDGCPRPSRLMETDRFRQPFAHFSL